MRESAAADYLIMQMCLKQKETGLFLASDGCWTEERKRARLFRSVYEAILSSLALAGPLELFYDLGHPEINFALPLSSAIKRIKQEAQGSAEAIKKLAT